MADSLQTTDGCGFNNLDDLSQLNDIKLEINHEHIDYFALNEYKGR
jgi:hypothetical protein